MILYHILKLRDLFEFLCPRVQAISPKFNKEEMEDFCTQTNHL